MATVNWWGTYHNKDSAIHINAMYKRDGDSNKYRNVLPLQHFSHISPLQFPTSLQLLSVQLPRNLHVLKITELWKGMTIVQTDQFLFQFSITSLMQYRKYLLLPLQFAVPSTIFRLKVSHIWNWFWKWCPTFSFFSQASFVFFFFFVWERNHIPTVLFDHSS